MKDKDILKADIKAFENGVFVGKEIERKRILDWLIRLINYCNSEAENNELDIVGIQIKQKIDELKKALKKEVGKELEGIE